MPKRRFMADVAGDERSMEAFWAAVRDKVEDGRYVEAGKMLVEL